ncbi:rhodanese-like domain-containing protein [Rossellomorea sp. AcN35-11]|nr:rhodanese-like domain-containing protein [Rossellomorea aquimaris]NMH68388.1 rhodanese-like domain-containing protein [Bacillus sp. RO3]WJV29815.1 rhodanese-like domain-containing protein [Rossellomorea sp. AcN35-11]
MKEIKPEEVAMKVKGNEDVSIIDVRENDEVAQGKIPGAAHIPLGELPNRMGEIDQTKEHIMVCRSGGRSGMAYQLLEEQGFKVLNMTGGMLDWKDEVEK